ncbi:MAG: UMP kinase [Clostridia bacterium]|nr:UMP kinase [Clostridia bacterium]
MPKYNRVLIKLSGEALGDHGRLFDFDQINRVAGVIAKLHETGTQIALVIGAGNIWRGRQGPAAQMTPVSADHMGMLGTAINSIAMQDAIQHLGVNAHVLSAVDMNRFCESYSYPLAIRYLSAGDVVIFACGTGNPFFSTDTAAALRSVEIGADAILLAKNVDGVYDSDPRLNPDARFLPDLTYHEVMERDLKVMDAAAITICRDNRVPSIRVFALDNPENILKVIDGDPMGTTVHP